MNDIIHKVRNILKEGAGRNQRFHSYTLKSKEDESGVDLKKMKRHSKILRKVLNKVRHLSDKK